MRETEFEIAQCGITKCESFDEEKVGRNAFTQGYLSGLRALVTRTRQDVVKSAKLR